MRVVTLLAAAALSHGTTTPQQAATIAHQWWAQHRATVATYMRNGQCTDWVWRKRPDIVERIYEASIQAKLLGRPFPRFDLDARYWATLARAAGLRVSTSPVAGAAVVWQPGVEGAGAPGHVAYVEYVGGGTFRFSEMNAGAPFVLARRSLSTAPVAGRLFILP
jgi:surface antigen